MPHINVVGAGISGLGTAMCLAEHFPDSDITITSSDWTPHTTSDHGFGIVVLRIFDIIDSPSALDNVLKTIDYCRSMDRGEADKAGVKLVEGVLLSNEATKEEKIQASYINQTAIGLREMTESEKRNLEIAINERNMKLLFGNEECSEETLRVKVGYFYVIDTGRHLPWLTRKLASLRHRDGRKRVRFVTKQLSRLTDVGSCDLIVNCSGLGAKQLANDEFVVPIRGQYVSLDASEVSRMLVANHTFLVPRFKDIAAGSVYQIGRSDQEIDPDDTEDILRRIEVLFPGVRNSKVRKVDVGIRPGRIGGPRVELEIKKCGCCDKQTPIIHNYGHGPRGIAQFWGCASTVAELASPILTLKSKL